VVAARRLPDALKDQVQELLAALADDPAARPVLGYGLINRFAPISDAAYDDIRAMLATIEAAGWTRLTQAVVDP
jgi:ABC-type phosphate/phosphonate transport system substrate-binding protein